MSKALGASCEAGIVTVESLPVEATVLSLGVKPSQGLAIIDEDKVTYLTSSATDIKDLITNLGDTLDKIITILTAHDAVTTSPGSQAANIALLVLLKTALVAQKEILK